MKDLSKLGLLLLGLTVVGCNETVSPELKNANSSSGGSSSIPTPTTPNTDYFFKVTETSPDIYGYKLHRTGFDSLGVSRKTTDCEVRTTNTPLDNDLYDAQAGDPHDQKEYDISCFLEVEELSLYLNGLKFEISASADTCSYIGYQPFSYFDRIPGDSSALYKFISCPEEATNNSTPNTDHSMNCGDYRDSRALTSLPMSPADENELCRFNYENGPSCDVGTITIREYAYQLSNTADPTSALVSTDTATRPYTERKISCAGQVSNCVRGPIRELNAQSSNFIQITRPAVGEAFSTSYKLKAPIDSDPNLGGGNYVYVNYRRNLASPEIDYGTAVPFQIPAAAGYAPYVATFDPTYDSATNYGKNFDPELMQYFSRNLMKDVSTPYVNAATPGVYSVSAQGIITIEQSTGHLVKPYAADPFMSVHPASRINPYYTFYCYDKAFDYKARIRLVVREWDRVFPDPSSSSAFDLISDIYRDAFGQQDNFYTDSYGDSFNDKADWDDFIPMVRSPGGYVNSSTTYSPVSGFFSPNIFPSQSE